MCQCNLTLHLLRGDHPPHIFFHQWVAPVHLNFSCWGMSPSRWSWPSKETLGLGQEIIDLFSKSRNAPEIPAVAFSRVVKSYTAQKARKQHDVITRQPRTHGQSRLGIGAGTLKDRPTGTPRVLHQCPECFRGWPTSWGPEMEKKCTCVQPAKKTSL